METYIKKAEDLEAINSNFIPPMLDAVLGDYNRNVPAARDAEVLNVMATITSRLGVSGVHPKKYLPRSSIVAYQDLLTPQVLPILDAVFEPTLSMINQDFSEYPEHRVGFFKLLRTFNMHCFPGMCWHLSKEMWRADILSALLGLPPPQFKMFIDSIIWAIKHTMRDIADMGLNCEYLSVLALSLIDFTGTQWFLRSSATLVWQNRTSLTPSFSNTSSAYYKISSLS